MPHTQTPSGITLNVDKTPIPIEDVTWVVNHSCGCISGMTLADQLDGTYLLTPEQALKNVFETVPHTKRAQADGVFCTPVYRRNATLSGRCTHTPTYGRTDATPADGQEWATADRSYGRQNHMRHIVPAERDSSDEALPAAALCGKTPKYAFDWTTEDAPFARIMSKVACLKCVKAAGGAGASAPDVSPAEGALPLPVTSLAVPNLSGAVY